MWIGNYWIELDVEYCWIQEQEHPSCLKDFIYLPIIASFTHICFKTKEYFGWK